MDLAWLVEWEKVEYVNEVQAGEGLSVLGTQSLSAYGLLAALTCSYWQGDVRKAACACTIAYRTPHTALREAGLK